MIVREKYGDSCYDIEDSLDAAKEREHLVVLEGRSSAGIRPTIKNSSLIKVDAERELFNMPGIKEAKEKIMRIIASRQLSIIRSKMGFESFRACPHLCFIGNPGTAKTTVARLIKDILFARGIISKDVFIECGRADLVGEHIGETAHIVRNKFEQAMGGILFIDEAYALIGDENDFGREAINAIVYEMENMRDNVMVICAGYPREIKQLLDMNEGLRSRIGDIIYFEDYSIYELMEIMDFMAEKHSLILSEDAKTEVRRIVSVARTKKNFGNGRFIRQLHENGYQNMAIRLLHGWIDENTLRIMKKSDFDGLMPKREEINAGLPNKIGISLK